MTAERAHGTIAIGGAAERWELELVEVHERLCAPTRVVVRAGADEAPDLEALIGADASVEVGNGAWARTFSGVVTAVDHVVCDRVAIELTIESRLSVLALGRDHRIYQRLTLPEIVADVLSRAGLEGMVEWRLNASYEVHENVVQYGESDLDFASRLLLEEGIGYLIEQREDGGHVVFFDDATAFTPIGDDALVELVPIASEERRGLRRVEEHVRLTPDQVAQREYDLRRPGADTSTAASADAAAGREVYAHPGGYTDVAHGRRRSERLLERLRLRSRIVECAGNVEAMAPGRTFTLEGSTRASLDGDYVALDVRHRFDLGRSHEGGHGAGLRYENELDAVAASVPVRPEHAPDAPVIAGVQHAFVTTPPGEEIHTDEHGRAKVRFPWDRAGVTDDKSSTWLRVGQLALGGSMLLPRGAFEVLVDFELGDLDRPAVSGAGHLYHAESPPPYALPAAMTISSLQTATTEGGPGANEVRFEDAAGSEEIYVHASRDLVVGVDHETAWTVARHASLTVGNDGSLTVGSDHRAEVAVDRALEIGGDHGATLGGAYEEGIGGDLTIAIAQNRVLTVGGDCSEQTGGALSRTVGSLQSVTGLAGMTRTIAGCSTTKAGVLWAELAGTGRAVNVAGACTETVAALKHVAAAEVSIACDAAYTMNAAAEKVDVGGSRIDEASGALALTAGGSLSIEAARIVLEAESRLVFQAGATVIELGKLGTVKIKAPKVVIENADALSQIMHKSN